MKRNRFFIIPLFVMTTSIVFGQQLPENVNKTFKSLYPDPGSISFTLFNDFYEIGYHDASNTGEFINLLIDVEGNFLGTITDETVSKDKKAEVAEKLGLDCSSPIVKIAKKPDGKMNYYTSCYYADSEGEKTIITLANEKLEVVKMGTYEVVY